MVVAASLTTNYLVGKFANSAFEAANQALKTQNHKQEHHFLKELFIQFIQSFSAILSALYISRALSGGAFKLNSWKNALTAFNQKSFILAFSISAFNTFLEFCSESAQKAQPHLQKIISFIGLAAKVCGSIGLVKLIGGLNPDASLGAVAAGCPCCGSPFIICLADLAALSQTASRPFYHWFQNLYLKIKTIFTKNDSV